MSGTNIVKVDFSDPLALYQDEMIQDAIWRSRHPACRKLCRWICHDLLPSVRRGQPGKWSGTRAEFDDMVRSAVRVAQRNIARRR